MEIGVDARVLTAGYRSGVEEYTSNILHHLIELAPHIKFKIFLNSFKESDLDIPWLDKPNVEIHKFHIPNRLLFPLAKISNFPKIDKLLGGVDSFFSPHFFCPISKSCHHVTVFHDLSFLRHPEFFPRKQNFWHNFQINPKAKAHSANKIISVSESTRSDIIDLLGVKAEKIKVIYSGIGDEFWQKINDNKKKELINKYNLPEKYILYAGTLEPRKNVVGIIEAFNQLKEYGFQDYHLVLFGGRGWLSKEIFLEIDRSPYRKLIKYIGFVPSNERPAIYSCADLFVYPSFFEGFGFPPLEAMAMGVPVITSNLSSIPEVVGDSAIMINPYNIGEISMTMIEILSDRKIHTKYIQKGFKRAKKFSWNKAARETMDLLTS